MRTKLAQVLAHFLQGREVTVWGAPSRLLARDLRHCGFPCRIAGEDEPLEPAKHYVIFPTRNDSRAFFFGGDHSSFRQRLDCWQYDDIGGELPFDWNCDGTPVGKWTYFGDRVAAAIENGYVSSIGRFTSMNSTAMIHVDHQFSMTFVSDEIVRLFSEEHQALFRQELLADPKLPYAANKSHPLVIGSDVWIGANAFINCSKVKSVGDGAVIGSGAVVLEDVPPYAVVAGVPAKIKRYRYPPARVEALLRVKWWDWDDDAIRANAEALINPEKFFAEFL
ncbi:MAG: CatB-related O-acetyltransferase [Oscillospiraceae bacterium]|jgi:aminocyclitol acetyltransferase|nr:CatB-related O-acetyltransferase [Oscillospiraceae bacterium]